MTPQTFIAKWGAPDGVPGPAFVLNEEQGAQSHFLDLCDLLGVPKPVTHEGYKFEEKSHIVGGKTGYADVFMQGVFAWENKAPGKNLDAALKQLLTYSLALANPPILVVSDRLTIRVHTQFTGHPSETHSVSLYELDQPEKQALLRRIWTAPHSFKPCQTSRDITEADASLYEAPFQQVAMFVRPERQKVRRERTQRLWWLHEEARVSMRQALTPLPRDVATPRVAKHRFFVFVDATVLPDTRLNVIARADDTTFGILSSRIHQVWSLAQASMHGVGNDPTYNAKSCFETFPFPPGLSPADTAHQRTEALEGGALIPADLPEKYEPKVPAALTGIAQTAMVNIKAHASAIAQAAHRLNALREAWLNPPEWTERIPEVVPLGLTTSPYPDRVVAKPGFEKQLAERTLTKLYNQRPAWLAQAHAALDAAVATAYGWTDYTPTMPDDEILKRLLALNLAEAAHG